MKKMFKTLGLLGVLASGSLIEASDYGHSLHVSVPFAFAVAGQQFSAGDYDVRETTNGVITVQGAGKAAMVIGTPGAPVRFGQPSTLRFANDVSRDLLSVTVEGEGVRMVPVHSITERKLALAQQ
jgi:hypothetical protein